MRTPIPTSYIGLLPQLPGSRPHRSSPRARASPTPAPRAACRSTPRDRPPSVPLLHARRRRPNPPSWIDPSGQHRAPPSQYSDHRRAAPNPPLRPPPRAATGRPAPRSGRRHGPPSPPLRPPPRATQPTAWATRAHPQASVPASTARELVHCSGHLPSPAPGSSSGAPLPRAPPSAALNSHGRRFEPWSAPFQISRGPWPSPSSSRGFGGAPRLNCTPAGLGFPRPWVPRWRQVPRRLSRSVVCPIRDQHQSVQVLDLELHWTSPSTALDHP